MQRQIPSIDNVTCMVYLKTKYATIIIYYGGNEPMAKTNYSYEKRGRELEKQKKQEEKRQKKLDKKNEDNKEEK